MNRRGFSTLEIMIAFAIMALVLSAAVLADFGTQYWTITSQTSNEALYKAKTALENLRASAKQDFLSATSSPFVRSLDTNDPADAACLAGGLCYYLQTIVTDLSSCSKYAEADVSWQVGGYPTTTASLFTTFANPTEALKLGSDCGLTYPSGNWTQPNASSPIPLSGTPTDIDVLNGVGYVSESTNPYLEVVSNGTAYPYVSADNVAFNALDVARDLTTGRTYAYVATASTTAEFQVIDVSDPTNPVWVAGLPLSNVSTTSPPVGWRLFYYDRVVYLTTPQNNGSSEPEFHVFDVGYPTVPTEVGTGYKLNPPSGTSVYGILVRDQYVQGSLRRFAYLATTLPAGELVVLDVTDPKNVGEVLGARTDLPGTQNGISIAISGDVLYLGRQSVTGGGPDVYALDVANPLAAAAGLPILGQVDVARDASSLEVAGPYLFVGTNKSGQEVQIRTSDPDTLSSLYTGSFSVANLTQTDIDFDNGSLYLVQDGNSPQLRVLQAP